MQGPILTITVTACTLITTTGAVVERIDTATIPAITTRGIITGRSATGVGHTLFTTTNCTNKDYRK